MTDDALDIGAHRLVRHSLTMSMVLFAMTAAYCLTATCIVETLDAGPTVTLIATATAVMVAWTNRRPIVEIPTYRNMLSDPNLKDSRGTVLSLIAIDVTTLLVSVTGAAWLAVRPIT